jgi:hypothetical protein
MREARRVRLIRKINSPTGHESPPEAAPVTSSPPSEREIKSVVSGWVREHRQQSEEFRLNFAALLKGGGFHLPSR